jgi:phosphoribosylanthranilate isomerase
MTIKVCGMRVADNIKAVASLPIDYMGFIFYEKSPRFVGDIIHAPIVLKNIKKVGVFVQADIQNIIKTTQANVLDIVQIHWDAPPQYLGDLREILAKNSLNNIEIWKVFSMDSAFDFSSIQPYEGMADKYLFDTKSPQHGGTGIKFDWSILYNYEGKTPFLLAGGISEEDAATIKHVNIPTLWGVDLNSKFELAPALKDIKRLKRFINTVNNLK